MEENTAVLKEINKDKKIKAEIKRLNEIFKNIEDKKKKTVKFLIENVAFMSVCLDELQEIINKTGYSNEYRNNINYGVKDSVEVKAYNTMIKNFMTAVKQLVALLPEDNEEEDELLNFIKRK